MGTQLHQTLRTLCFNSDWKYVVFWKLNHQARTMLAWEDAYYNYHEQHEPPKNTCSTEMGVSSCEWLSHDPLGLALAKMSYHVHSLGEGVIGHVAVTGKHMWIFADEHETDMLLPFGHFDGWQTQFSAGIRTVVLVAIFPHGVVQLGSLNKVPEALKMLNHIRDIFSACQHSMLAYSPSVGHCSLNSSSSCLTDISSGSLVSGNFLSSMGRPVSNDDMQHTPADHAYTVPLVGNLLKKTDQVTRKDGELELSASGGAESAVLLNPRSEVFLLEQHEQVWKRLLIDRNWEWEPSSLGYPGAISEVQDSTSSNNLLSNDPVEFSVVDCTCLQPVAPVACKNQNRVLCSSEPFGIQIQRGLEKNMQSRIEINKMQQLTTCFKSSAGCELDEVLRPGFERETSYYNLEAENMENETAIMMLEGMDSSSLLTADSGSDNLLEAVVANVCCGGNIVKIEKSLSESVKSTLTTGAMPLTIHNDQSLIEQDTLHCLSSNTGGMRSSKGFLSRIHSTLDGQLDIAKEPAKISRKRARPGENSRPRPRDRQLIQDRIKELRDLVPSGSKCRIDSLLERTIKHMLFMRRIIKHAEKLKKSTKPKLLSQEPVVRGLPRHDQGSTWAVELGSHLNFCPIMIENVNMNGQMMIEMMCEDCSHFLKIAEAIRSLGLIILKSATKACGKKTRMCFVVEEPQNRSIHRLDILWTLVPILQSWASL